jgi:uncharacterized protein (TIGR00730 family)
MPEAELPASRFPLRDDTFLQAPDARPLRLLAEYLQPLDHFRREGIHDTIVFFGSSRISEGDELGRYYREARELARRLTAWSREIGGERQRFVVCSGGGPGIMEAANRGARDAGGTTIGLNIGLPFEQRPNPYITPSLSFEFEYFFMRKFWFAHLARALVVFPGGLGTLNELTELLMLVQTGKLKRPVFILLYGTPFWKEVLNFEALERHGVVSPEDLRLFRSADDPEGAFCLLRDYLTTHCLPDRNGETPSIAASTHSGDAGSAGPATSVHLASPSG